MTRRGFIKGLLATMLAGLFVAFYGFFIEPALRLRVKKWKVTRADWPEDAPLKIVVISDIHVGEPFIGLERVRQVVRRANALSSDLVVLLGDYAASHRFVTKPVKIEDVAPILAQLEAKHGVYSVLGNHDWWDDIEAQRRGSGPNRYGDLLEREGIPVLSNQAVKLPEVDVWLAGLEDQLAVRGPTGRWEGLDDLPATLAEIPEGAPAILMAHEPDIFPQVPQRIALTLSGHTHGGQIRLFGWSPVVPSRFGNKYAYGHVHEDGRSLVVSGGIGCSIMPVRFGVVPEITEVHISRA